VAFPQDGLYRAEGARTNLIRALDMGVDVVGGIPHFERTMEDGAASVKRLCQIAADRGLPVDLHCDETDDPMSGTWRRWRRDDAAGLGGRVVASHVTAMHSYDNYYATKLIPLIAESGMHVVPNPLINITLQGRSDTYPKRRGLTRVPELRAAGVNVAFGQDCTMDPWYSLGSADMLEVAHMGVHAVPMTSREAMAWAFDSVTRGGAAAMGLPDPTLRVGGPATMVVLQARDPIEAIRLKATRLAVIREGKVLSRTPARALPRCRSTGRPDTLDPADYAPPGSMTPVNRNQPTTKDAAMTFNTTRRTLMMGAAATLALPAYIRRVNAQSALRVAGVHASPVENAWNSRIHLAMQQAAEAGLIEYEFSEGVAATDYPRAMREYAESRRAADLGRSLCRGTRGARSGGGLSETAFLMGSSGGPEGDNFGVFGTRNHEAAYLAGMLAGTMSESNVFGSVGGYPIPEVNLLINAFRMGVIRGEPGCHLPQRVHRRMVRPRARAGNGHRADRPGRRHPLRRADRHGGRAQARGVKAIGSLIDYTPRYPETVFANAIWNYGPTIEAIVADVQAGNPVGRDYTEYSFMAYGGNELIYVPEMVPAEAIPAMEAKQAMIEAGEFEVPIDADEPA
jgi:basic membrane protein A